MSEQKQKKPGRPKLHHSKARNQRMEMRLTKAEKTLIQNACKRYGLTLTQLVLNSVKVLNTNNEFYKCQGLALVERMGK